MINSLHRERYGSLPVCTEIFSFDFAGKSYPPFIEYALTHNQHVCPIYVHSHEEPELIHVLNGELDITTGGRRARLRKGETALISPRTERILSPDAAFSSTAISSSTSESSPAAGRKPRTR